MNIYFALIVEKRLLLEFIVCDDETSFKVEIGGLNVKKKKNIKFIASWIMYFVGFIWYVAFLSATQNISAESWLYTIGASVGVALFCLSGYLRQ